MEICRSKFDQIYNIQLVSDIYLLLKINKGKILMCYEYDKHGNIDNIINDIDIFNLCILYKYKYGIINLHKKINLLYSNL